MPEGGLPARVANFDVDYVIPRLWFLFICLLFGME